MIELLTQPQLHLGNILNSYDWYQKVQNRNLSHLCSNFWWEFFRFFYITCSQSVCSWMLEIKFVLPKRLIKTHSTSSTNQTELWADGLCMYVSVLERFLWVPFVEKIPVWQLPGNSIDLGRPVQFFLRNRTILQISSMYFWFSTFEHPTCYDPDPGVPTNNI